MSTSKQAQRLTLTIKCADSATEIFVIDGQFNLLDRGVGRMSTQLEPGLYKVKVRAGFETSEQHVILRDHDEMVEIPPFNFVSAAPLADTSKTHEFHMAAAVEGSRNFDLTPGIGSSIFIFSRDWTSDTPPVQLSSTYPNPGRALTLRSLTGDVIADLTTEGKRSNGWEPWVGCNVRIDPGFYLLSLQLPDARRIEQTIVASEGWQTQIFLLQRNYGEESYSRLPDLRCAAIQMARLGQGFDPGNKLLRLTELARLGLANERRVLAEDLRLMLADKCENPMLGILSAHLLLLDKNPGLNRSLLQTVVTNLNSLLPGRHPDVDALALHLNPEGVYVCDVPPMLGKSWRLIVRETAKRPEIIPEGSMAGDISTHVWDTCPWLIWFEQEEVSPDRGSGHESIAEESDPLSNVEQILQSRIVAAIQQNEIVAGATSHDVVHLRPPREGRLESSFAAISRMRSAAVKKNPPMPVARSMALPDKSLVVEKSPGELKEETIDKLVESLNIPRGNLERLISKLNANTDEPATIESPKSNN